MGFNNESLPLDGREHMTGISGRVGDILGASVEAKLFKQIYESEIPKHLAVIMDGNRRFAWTKGIPASIGHRKGKEKLE